MAKSEERVYRLNLEQFHRYLDEKRRELEACYKDVEEVQFQFNDIFKRELAAWQEKFSFCFPRLLAGRRELPPALAQLLDRTEAEERARLEQEIANLAEEIRAGRAKMDELTAQAQAANEALRRANPELNAQEEQIKARVVRYEDEYAQAFEEMERLRAAPLGGLLHGAKIRRLQKVQRLAKQQQTKLYAQLRQVRQAWQDKIKEAGDTQAALREEWQKVSVRVAEAQARHDHLQANLDTLAEQKAAQRVLEEMREPPDVPGELGQALKELVERNHVRWDYEQGLRAVAEVLGLTKGVGEGLKRFQKSVATVLQEQRRYNLKPVEVLLPQSVVTVNETWKELQAKVKDEKYMGAHPLEFSRTVDAYIKQRLTDAKIQDLFEQMGNALNQATAAWK